MADPEAISVSTSDSEPVTIIDSESECTGDGAGGEAVHDDGCDMDPEWPPHGQTPMMLEMFSPPRIVPLFKEYGGSGISKDATTGWDASRWEDRSSLWAWQLSTKPDVLFGCPPCTMYSKLQLTNKRKMGVETFDKRLADADILLDFQMDSFRQQVRENKGFLFEHPDGASSWKKPSVSSMHLLPGVFAVCFDQCRYGLKDPEGKPLKKPTRLLSNMISVWNEFNGKSCRCLEPHGQCQGRIQGVQVSTYAQVYPPALAAAFAKCCAKHVGLSPLMDQR